MGLDSNALESTSRVSFVAQLEALLVDMFTAGEFARFLETNFYRSLVCELPDYTQLSRSAYIHESVALLQRHGLLNDRFFRLLRRARPLRVADIARVQELVQNAEQEQGQSPRPPNESDGRWLSINVRIGPLKIVVVLGVSVALGAVLANLAEPKAQLVSTVTFGLAVAFGAASAIVVMLSILSLQRAELRRPRVVERVGIGVEDLKGESGFTAAFEVDAHHTSNIALEHQHAGPFELDRQTPTSPPPADRPPPKRLARPSHIVCPFVGPRSFSENEADIFFGRDQERHELLNKTSSMRPGEILVVSGKSGVGKSSLLRAGLVASLRESGLESAYLGRARDIRPDVVPPVASGSVLILDHFEEFFKPAAPPEWGELWMRAVLAQFRIIIAIDLLYLKSCRAWLASLLGEASETDVVMVKRLGPARLQEAMSRPLNSFDWGEHPGGIDTDLQSQLIREMTSDPRSPIAPALQAVMRDLWLESKGRPSLSCDDYDADRRARVWNRLIETGFDVRAQLRASVDSGLVASVLKAFIPDGVRHDLVLSRRELVKERFPPERSERVERIIDHLCQRRLITEDESFGERTLHLLHACLAPAVSRVFYSRDWPACRAERILRLRADLNSEAGGDADGMLTPVEVRLVKAGLVGMRALTESERQLLERSASRIRLARWFRVLVCVLVVSTVVILDLLIVLLFGSVR